MNIDPAGVVIADPRLGVVQLVEVLQQLEITFIASVGLVGLG